MMTIDDIRTLYAYTVWANRRIVDAARSLDRAEYTRDLGTSFRSVQGTLVHILWAEWIWLRRWVGESPKRVFQPEEFPRVEELAARWAELERERDAFLAGLTDERLAARISYENTRGERWEYPLEHMMGHVANHSTYHRGQIVTLLRQLGKGAPETDFLVYMDEVAAGRVR